MVVAGRVQFLPPCLLWDHLVATSDTANVGIEYKRLDES